MQKETLKPGDKVVDIKYLYIVSSILSGASVSAATIWKFNQRLLPTILSIIVCIILMFFLSRVLSNYFYLIRKKETTVVKAGKTAIPLTLKATIIGGLIAMVICGVIYSFILGGVNFMISCLLINLIITFCISIVLGILSAVS